MQNIPSAAVGDSGDLFPHLQKVNLDAVPGLSVSLGESILERPKSDVGALAEALADRRNKLVGGDDEDSDEDFEEEDDEWSD